MRTWAREKLFVSRLIVDDYCGPASGRCKFCTGADKKRTHKKNRFASTWKQHLTQPFQRKVFCGMDYHRGFSAYGLIPSQAMDRANGRGAKPAAAAAPAAATKTIVEPGPLPACHAAAGEKAENQRLRSWGNLRPPPVLLPFSPAAAVFDIDDETCSVPSVTSCK